MKSRSIVGAAALLAATVLTIAPAYAGRTVRTDSGALPDRFTRQPLTWQACGDDIPAELRCTTVDAPMDYRNPEAGTLKITFSKLATSKPGKRRGVLFFNPGGPGGSGLREPEWKRDQLPPRVLEQYDLIGFDPRGVGRSTPLKCGLTGAETVQFFPYQPEMYDHHVGIARSVAAKCAAARPLAAHVSTRNTARDMDLIRALLGEARLSYFGVSYGTYLGAVYTQMFPDRTDRVVLDSNIDPARAWNGVFHAMTAAAAADFDRFTRWAAERDATYHLGRTPKAVEATFWKLAARVKRNPIDIDGQPFTEQDARSTMASTASQPESAVQFLRDLRNALDGKPHELIPIEKGIPEGDADDAATSLYWAILCNDVSTWPRGAQAYRQDAVRTLRRYPLVGDFATNVKPCAFWSLPRTEPDVQVANDVPALIVQNQWDPFTPGTMGRGMHRALRASRLVMVAGGTTHVVYGGGNPCADAAVHSYLATGRLPARNITCSVTPAEAAETAKATGLPARPFSLSDAVIPDQP